MQDDKEHKIKIDKEILAEFLLSNKTPSQVQVTEVVKVFTVVIVKHFNTFILQKDDLFSYAWVAVLSRRKNFKESFSPYNFIYTIARNEIGNAIKRYGKEDYVDKFLPNSRGFTSVSSNVEFELPVELNKFKKYLTGEEEFILLDLKPLEAFYLCAFVLSNIKFRTKRIPDFLQENPDVAQILYKTINLLL